MRGLTGFRKVLIFVLALGCFESILLILKTTDPGAIVAIGSQIAIFMGTAIYGNVKEHQARGMSNDQRRAT